MLKKLGWIIITHGDISISEKWFLKVFVDKISYIQIPRVSNSSKDDLTKSKVCV